VDNEKRQKYKECSPALMDRLTSNISRLRSEKGLSQEKLAELSGLHRTFVNAIENHGKNVTLGVLEAMSIALEVDIVELIALPPPPPSK